MRALVTFASLLVCATAAQAQAPDRQDPVAPPAAEAAAVGAVTATPASDRVDVKARAVTAADIGAVRLPAPAAAEAPADSDEAAQDITAPQNFWWLVGGIVLAGIILAVIL